MRLFVKFVAGALGLTLWVLPLFVAIPCRAIEGAGSQCAKCCAGMAGSAMMGATEDSMTPTPFELTYPPCCQISSGETSRPAIVQETQRRVTLAVSQLDGEVQAFNAAPDLREAVGAWPPLPLKSSPQSILCTFRI
jgi:hypothetical protein